MTILDLAPWRDILETEGPLTPEQEYELSAWLGDATAQDLADVLRAASGRKPAPKQSAFGFTGLAGDD